MESLTPSSASSEVARPSVHVAPRHLRVHFGEGSPHRWADFHHRWLRHQCDRDLHPVTRERLVDPADISEDIRPSSAWIDAQSGQLVVRWASDGRESRYDLAWLATHAYAPERALPPPPVNDPAALTLSSRGRAEDDVVAEILPRLARDGAVIVRATDDPRRPEDTTAPWIESFARAGLHVRSTHFGYIEDLRTDNTTNANTDQLGYTDAAVALHTDQPFLDVPPRYQVLQCIRPGDTGGENVVADARAADRWIAALDAAAHALLRTVPVRFHRRQKAFEAIVDAPLLTEGTEGFRVRASYFTLAPFALPFEQMEAWYRAYAVFTRFVRDPAHHCAFRLGPGDFVIYDNWRMLHARTGFTGPRWMRGIYLDPPRR